MLYVEGLRVRFPVTPFQHDPRKPAEIMMSIPESALPMLRRTVAACLLCGILAGVASADVKPVKARRPLIPAGVDIADVKPVEARRPLIAPKVARTTKLAAVFSKPAPTSREDLAAMQSHVQKLIKKITAATVGVVVGRAQGSGVVVSSDGYILTAGHVSGKSGRNVLIIFPNGKKVRGKTLGANNGVDAGMIKITDKGKWPHDGIGDMEDVTVGDWCIAIGHPGGFRAGRTPVVRLGRIISANARAIHTDATLVGGDSGGPLFDMHGRVIGINSRIGRKTTQNIHVPISAYSEGWVKMARSEVWGSRSRRSGGAIMGINGKNHAKGCVVTDVPLGFPAARAGFKVGDVITKFDGKTVKTFAGLVQLVSKKRPGNKVVVELIRGGKAMKLTLTLARR